MVFDREAVAPEATDTTQTTAWDLIVDVQIAVTEPGPHTLRMSVDGEVVVQQTLRVVAQRR